MCIRDSIQGVVVEALRQKDSVGEAEVNGESDDGGHEISPKSTGEVGDVSGHPYQQEGDGDAVRRRLTVILDQLRHLEKSSQAQVRAYATKAAKGFFTSRKIQQAREILPAMPEKASCTVRVTCSNIVARGGSDEQRWCSSVSQSSYVIEGIGFCGMLTFASLARVKPPLLSFLSPISTSSATLPFSTLAVNQMTARAC